MGKIVKMSPALANLIAAGEVVERPSSVVKELVENSIDAHATNIQVYLKNGGLDEIRIIDDGEGMESSDVELAFLPHATSKIKSEYDLLRISSLGFRGEAIASIASVSWMQIISSPTGMEGYQVTYEAGMKKQAGITHSNKGTIVIVKNLFFNTPARMKYLKPAKNELAAISYFMDRIALAYPDIRFSLINDDKRYLNTSGSSKTLAMMGEVYGLEVAKNIIEQTYMQDGTKIHLVLVKPEIYRSNKLEITFIVNGRYVKNYNLTNAILEGYKTFLPIGKYPICVVYIDIDPILIDVNVHPSKVEIKISNEEILKDFLSEKIVSLLSQTRLIPTRKIDSNEGYQKTSIFELPRVELEEEKIEYRTPKPILEAKENRLPQLEYVGQAFGTYLIFQSEDGLYLMDQHAAAERINYEKNYELLGRDNQPTSTLLVPIMLEFTKSERLFIEGHMNELNEIGFVIEPLSETDYVIRQVPLWAKLDDLEDKIREIFALLMDAKKVDVKILRDEIAKTISCKSSIKANHALSRREIDSLLEQLGHCKNPFTCPHGRPTIIHFSPTELEKMFERIQS
ncbi:MAG: DNA mismatch repair endonuclease MutL [Anaeroplasmataceae bacterium]|nr:DNA mismatch repair endonuclease MutL [Anaeroplasmataceae bacterium]